MKISLAILCASLVVTTATAGDPVVEGILADWKARQTKFKTARYVVTGYSERMDLPSAPKQPYSLNVLIDVYGKRLRIEKATSGPTQDGKFIESRSTSAFDGKVRYAYTPRDINGIAPTAPNIFQAKGNLTLMAYDFDVWPILEAHGIVPLTTKIPRPDKLPIEHDSASLSLRGDVLHDSRKVNMLRSESANTPAPLYDDFLIDRQRSGAIVRHAYISGKNPFVRLDTTFTTQSGSWMPSAWTCTQFGGTKVIGKVAVKVDRSEFDVVVSDEDFVLTAKAGDVLRVDTFPEPGEGLEPTQPAMKTFAPNASGKLVLVSETGYVAGSGEALPPESHSRRWWWLLLVPPALAIGILSWRRVKRTSPVA